MTWQIIRDPKRDVHGYGVFSTVSERIIVSGKTKSQIAEWFVHQAEIRERAAVKRQIHDMDMDPAKTVEDWNAAIEADRKRQEADAKLTQNAERRRAKEKGKK